MYVYVANEVNLWNRAFYCITMFKFLISTRNVVPQRKSKGINLSLYLGGLRTSHTFSSDQYILEKLFLCKKKYNSLTGVKGGLKLSLYIWESGFWPSQVTYSVNTCTAVCTPLFIWCQPGLSRCFIGSFLKIGEGSTDI